LAGILLIVTVTGGGIWAQMDDQTSGGPVTVASAELAPAPTGVTTDDGGCAGTNQSTNVSLSWTDGQSATADASGGSLVTGYTVGRSSSSAGSYVAAGSVAGNPAPTTYTDTPTVAGTPVGLVANTGKKIYPVSESALSAGAAVTIGTTSDEANAIQITPDGLSAVVAEYGSNQVQVLTWSGSAWAIAKTLAVTGPTAVAIDPVATGAGTFVAYVVSDPGSTVDGSLVPVSVNGASSSLGTSIAIGEQANPTAVVVTPNGAMVFVANFNSNTVSAVSTATSTVTNVALPGTTAEPIALATTFDSSHVYVADRANSYIDDISVATTSVSAYIVLATGALDDTVLTTSGNPNVMAMLPSGVALYVAEFGSSQVQVVDTALSGTPDTLGTSISTGSGSEPIDLASSPNGCLIYVADWPSNDIFSIATSTDTEATVFVTTCQTQDPQPFQVTPDNQYLVIPENYSCGDLEFLDTATDAVTTARGVGSVPVMIAFPPIPIWYTTTATHALWNSSPSTPTSYPAGWDPGGWQ
jgi:DNA-binding beta-propeller fold protein YncE